MSVLNVMVIHPVRVEIFQSGPKWLTDKSTLQFQQPCYLQSYI